MLPLSWVSETPSREASSASTSGLPLKASKVRDRVIFSHSAKSVESEVAPPAEAKVINCPTLASSLTSPAAGRVGNCICCASDSSADILWWSIRRIV